MERHGHQKKPTMDASEPQLGAEGAPLATNTLKGERGSDGGPGLVPAV